jgi:hypothetical protein
MKITNKFGLPEPLVRAVIANLKAYSKGDADYSVTEIMSPPRIQRLRKRYYHKMESDVTDHLWSFYGSFGHKMIEGYSVEGHQSEERIFCDIDGTVLSGAIDLQKTSDGGVEITDYKFTSSYSLRGEKIEWVQQLNIYAYLVWKKYGKKVTSLRVCAFVKDFSKREAQNNPAYPQASGVMVDIPIWDYDKTEAYIRERIDLHKTSKVNDDWGDELPECSDEERWIRETKYAVIKEGNKRATKVFDTHEEASVFWETMPKSFIEVRKGEAVRCTGNYCGVSQWCTQFNKEAKDVA